jgi:hypothetical protein
MAYEVEGSSPEIIEETTDEEIEAEKKEIDSLRPLGEWVVTKAGEWRTWRDNNFLSRWKEYDRIWRGIYGTEDSPGVVRSKQSRSTFVSPATASAIDSATAEIEEATWGRGKPFVIETKDASVNTPDVTNVEVKLYSKLKAVKARASSSQSILNGAIYGTGIAEIVVEKSREKIPMEQPDPQNSERTLVGRGEKETVQVYWKPIQPNNFLIDPNAGDIDKALGVCIEEFVSDYVIHTGIDKGLYRKLEDCAPIQHGDQEKDFTIDPHDRDRSKLTRYYGLVPKKLLFPTEETVDLGVSPASTTDKEYKDEEWVEAIVVVLNDQYVLKAEENPFLMKDRPVVAFSWSLVPNRFWGRGLAEMGYNAQRALDSELRARQDSLALTVWPMMGMDAARIPKGFKFEVGPGKSVLTNGNPNEILMPFKFGQVDGNLYQDAQELEKMIFQATGAVDLTGIPGQINGDATAAGMSMSLSGAIKRYKKTLLNFHEQFLIPAIEKTMWRYIQFAPEEFTAQPYNIEPSTALGIIAREYETQQMVGLLQNMQPGTPEWSGIMMGIVDNSNLPNRSELIQMLQQKMQPDPQAQQLQQAQMQLQMAEVQAKIRELNARASKQEADASYTTNVKPKVEMVNAMAEARAADGGDPQYEKLVKTAELAIKEKAVDVKREDIASNERIARLQMTGKVVADMAKARNKNNATQKQGT